MCWDPETLAFLDAVDDLIEAEARARRSLEWDETAKRPRRALHRRGYVDKYLWTRHRPEKNQYEVRNGRRVVSVRVFVQRGQDINSDQYCHYCMCDDIVCRTHEFSLRGRAGVDRYMDDAVYYDYWQ